MAVLGIDVSEMNGKVNWAGIKTDFAILRGGYGYGDEDGEVMRNAENCPVPFGLYWFSYAYSEERAKTEADKALSVIAALKNKPAMPIFFDWEYDSDRYAKQNGVTVDKALFSAMARAFMDRIKEKGYKAGIYYNHDYYNNYCDASVLDSSKYYQWYAFYGDGAPVNGPPEGEPAVPCDIWQYSSAGTIEGFSGDINLLKNLGLLGEGPAPEPTPGENPNSRVLQTGKNQITDNYSSGHAAVDIVKDYNQLDGITAHTQGVVVFSQTGIPNDKGSTGNRSYGNCVKLQHPNGYYTLYAHMAYIDVHKGDTVARGQKVGYMGDTGNAYGAHLHFEVRNVDDVRIDPTPYLNAELPGGGSKYTPGTYRITADVLTVREGPGTEYNWLRYSQLTPNARAQIDSLAGYPANGYVKGMICDVSEVKGAWGRTPSGWICLDYAEKI